MALFLFRIEGMCVNFQLLFLLSRAIAGKKAAMAFFL